MCANPPWPRNGSSVCGPRALYNLGPSSLLEEYNIRNSTLATGSQKGSLEVKDPEAQASELSLALGSALLAEE